MADLDEHLMPRGLNGQVDDPTRPVVGGRASVPDRAAIDVGRRRGVRAVAALLAVSLVSAGIGWIAARGLKSPAEVAARTAAPSASRITAPVELRVLRSTLFTRGTVRFGSPKAITLPASSVKTGSLVVTAPPVKGRELKEGSKAGDLGGRPVMVLAGKLPMYRDIRPGDSGEDVVGLKAALGRLGFNAGSGGVFDGAAQQAVAKWMSSLGYTPFGPTDSQLDRLRTASDSAQKSGEQVLAAESALSKGSSVVTPDKLLATDEAIRVARDRTLSARTDADRTVSQADLSIVQKQIALNSALVAVTSAETGVQRAGVDANGELTMADAMQSVTAAKQRVIDADAAVVKANRGVESAIADRDDANQAVVDANQAVTDAGTGVANGEAALEKARVQPPPTIPVGNGTFQVDLDGARQAVKQAEGVVASANTSLRNAQTQLRTAQRTVVRSTQAIDDAKANVESAVSAAAQAREAARLADIRFRQAQIGPANGSGASSPVAAAGSAGAPSTPETSSGASSTGAGAGAGAAVSPSSAVSGSSDGANSSSAASQSAASGGGIGGGGAQTLAQAQAALDQAKAQLTIAQADFDQAKKATEPTKAAAQNTVRAADVALRIAVAQRAELLKPADLATLQASVAAAKEAKVRADADLAKLQSETGVTVPANEVVFIDGLPLRIDDTKLSAGDALSGAFMTVASKRLAIDSSVDPADASSLKVGQDAEIEATDLGITLPAKVSKIATQTGTNGVDASRIYVELTPNETTTETEDTTPATTVAPDGNFGPGRKPRLEDLNGLSIKVTIPISTTGGEVLVVPTAAVSAAPDGSTRVEVETDPAKPTTFVAVAAGLRAEGYVQVTPTVKGTLKQGDLVITGTRNGEPLQGVPGPNDRSAPGQPTADESGVPPAPVAETVAAS